MGTVSPVPRRCVSTGCTGGTIPLGHTQGVHLVAAYLPHEAVTLVQVQVAAKDNEITVAPSVPPNTLPNPAKKNVRPMPTRSSTGAMCA